jgi:hypothetical protein
MQVYYEESRYLKSQAELLRNKYEEMIKDKGKSKGSPDSESMEALLKAFAKHTEDTDANFKRLESTSAILAEAYTFDEHQSIHMLTLEPVFKENFLSSASARQGMHRARTRFEELAKKYNVNISLSHGDEQSQGTVRKS